MHLLTNCKIRNINIILRNPYCFWQKSNSEHGLYKFSVVQSVSQEQCHGHADNLVQVKYSINSKYQMLILRSNVKDQTSLDIDVFWGLALGMSSQKLRFLILLSRKNVKYLYCYDAMCWWINSVLTCSFYSCSGFNPRWDEHVSFVIGQPDHAIIRFVVYDHDRYVDDFIGYFALPFHSIQEGKSYISNFTLFASFLWTYQCSCRSVAPRWPESYSASHSKKKCNLLQTI